MFAVVKTGGKQYRVAANDVISVERMSGEPGDIVELGQVLMFSGDEGVEMGTPLVAGVTVAAEVLRQERARHRSSSSRSAAAITIAAATAIART